MDVDMLNSSSSPSSAADHSLDMMTIMMQMEKSPEFCNNHFYHNTPTYPEINFSTSGTNSTSTTNNLTNSPLPIFHNPSNSSVSVLTNPIQEPNVVIPSERFKNGRAVLYPNSYENKKNSMAAMREMIFRIASMQPIHIDPESIKPPKRRNVKISKDPQSVAARHRRERISERIRILQRLVPGGTKMDTASMLDEAIHYVKFLKKQVQNLEQAGASTTGFTGTQLGSNVNYSSFMKACQPPSHQMTVGSIQMLR